MCNNPLFDVQYSTFRPRYCITLFSQNTRVIYVHIKIQLSSILELLKPPLKQMKDANE